MSEKKYSENDPERTLITLDQLSQTIEVMTTVVNRLRQHLSQQISVRKEIEELEREQRPDADAKAQSNRENFMVEVSKPEDEPEDTAEEKTLH